MIIRSCLIDLFFIWISPECWILTNAVNASIWNAWNISCWKNPKDVTFLCKRGAEKTHKHKTEQTDLTELCGVKVIWAASKTQTEALIASEYLWIICENSATVQPSAHCLSCSLSARSALIGSCAIIPANDRIHVTGSYLNSSRSGHFIMNIAAWVLWSSSCCASLYSFMRKLHHANIKSMSICKKAQSPSNPKGPPKMFLCMYIRNR